MNFSANPLAFTRPTNFDGWTIAEVAPWDGKIKMPSHLTLSCLVGGIRLILFSLLVGITVCTAYADQGV
jgi:hypothetical protein